MILLCFLFLLKFYTICTSPLLPDKYFWHTGTHDQNGHLLGENSAFREEYWRIWAQNYVLANSLLASSLDNCIHFGAGMLNVDFTNFLLSGRTAYYRCVYIGKNVRHPNHYFDELISFIAMSEFPELVMDIHVELADGFKCPDALFKLSGFIDKLPIFNGGAEIEAIRSSDTAQSAKSKTGYSNIDQIKNELSLKTNDNPNDNEMLELSKSPEHGQNKSTTFNSSDKAKKSNKLSTGNDVSKPKTVNVHSAESSNQLVKSVDSRILKEHNGVKSKDYANDKKILESKTVTKNNWKEISSNHVSNSENNDIETDNTMDNLSKSMVYGILDPSKRVKTKDYGIKAPVYYIHRPKPTDYPLTFTVVDSVSVVTKPMGYGTPAVSDATKPGHLARFLINHPLGINFEVRMHYSPENEDKWSKLELVRIT